ncbi:MAG: hypothetical protein ACFFG0_48180 [Candidatus Thorarchaeota archaeon]
MNFDLNKAPKNNLKKIRVRARYDCHEYWIINVNDYKVIKSLHQFKKMHCGHRTQIVHLDELNPRLLSGV